MGSPRNGVPSPFMSESIIDQINVIATTNHTIFLLLGGRHAAIKLSCNGRELAAIDSALTDLVDLQSRRLAELDKCCRLHG